MGTIFKIEALIWVSFEMLPYFSPSVEGLVQIQHINPKIIDMKYKTNIKLVHETYGTCFRDNVKNQESII